MAPTTDPASLASAADALRVSSTRIIAGPSPWHAAPVIRAELRASELAALAPAEASGFADRLRAALPAGASDEAATSWGGTLVQVACELYRRAGAHTVFGRVVASAAREGRWTIVLAYDEPGPAVETILTAARVLRDCLRGDDPEIERTVADLARQYQGALPGPTSVAMIEAARARGIPVRRNPDGTVRLGLGSAQRRLQSTTTDATSAIATSIASDRHWTRDVLKQAGLPVPEGTTARTLERALEIAAKIGFPLLIKPIDASNGRGTSGRLDSLDEVRAAWPAAAAEHPAVIVERFARGNDHRVVVVNRRVIACVERVPAHVIGDGTRTIRALAPLPLDELTVRHLAREGRTLDTVPHAGETVALRATASISTGGTAVDRTDEMHPRNRLLCELAAGAVGLDVAGLDVRTPDIGVPFDENDAVIVEIDASPGIRMHTHPDAGAPRDVPGAILDMLYPPGAPVTIPLLAITGTNGKTTTTRLIAHLFGHAGARVGFTTTDGVYFQDQLLKAGDLTGPYAANIILGHRDVDVAVLETARGGILRAGLGWDACDVGVVMNVTADHLGMGGVDTLEQLAEVKAVIPGAVKPTGHAVLNADDPLVLAMRDRTRGRVALFTIRPLDDSNPATAMHAAGAIVACLEREGDDEQLVIRDGTLRVPLGAARALPLTFGGAARFQIQNLLAAALAAYVQGVPAERLRDGLMSFVPSADRTPGRLNVVETVRGRVILDYAHNEAAIAGLLDFVAATPAVHRMALISVPGDRRDEDLRAVGRLAAGMDYAIFKEHASYRRGRAAGHGARLLAEGLLATGFPADRVAVFDEEPAAVAHALERMRPGSVTAIIADSSDVTEQLRPYFAEGS